MNILWISQNIPYPPKTGVLQRNYNLIREASRYGDITLLAVYKENIIPGKFDLTLAKNELGKFCKRIEIVHLPIESSKFTLYMTALKSLFTKDPFSVNWIKCKEMTNAIRILTSENDYDLIHYDTISLAAFHHLSGNTTKVLNHHNIESHLIQRRTQVENNPIKRLYYHLEGIKLQRYEAEVCPKFDMNFTVSELDKIRLLDLAPGTKAEVIANGVDTEYFKSSENKEKPGNLIMVSGMNWFPNRDAVIYMCEEIWPLIAKKLPNITWTVVGACPPQQLLDLAKDDDRITVTGFVDDVRPYLEESHIYLCPMRDGGGTRLKILDALAMGKAIIATTMAFEGISTTPEHNVLVADTPIEFVNQIERLMNDDNLLETLKVESRKFVIDNYSWEVIGKSLETVYSTLCGPVDNSNV